MSELKDLTLDQAITKANKLDEHYNEMADKNEKNNYSAWVISKLAISACATLNAILKYGKNNPYQEVPIPPRVPLYSNLGYLRRWRKELN